MMLPRFQ